MKPEATYPKVSVIVSVYKAEAFMRECLTDLAHQTISDQLEIVVVDAASPENERDIILEFQERYSNILYIRTPVRIGVYAAWNLAIRNCSAPYITPFSANDRLCRTAYEQLSAALDENPDAMLVYGDTHMTATPHQTFESHDRSDGMYWPDYSYEFLLVNNCIGPHPMWRRQAHELIGLFDERFMAQGDQEFWLRMGEQFKLLHLPIVTGLYWISKDGISNQRHIADPEFREIRSVYARRYLERMKRNDS